MKQSAVRKICILMCSAFCLINTGCAPLNGSGSGLMAKEGILDLRKTPFPENGPVPLKGEWEFHWLRFHAPVPISEARSVDHVFLPVPGYWNGLSTAGNVLKGEGYATLRLKILLNNEKRRRLALYLPTVETAYRLYADGCLIAGAGKPGVDAKQSIPEWKPQVVVLEQSGDKLDLIMQVSNFHHVRGGPGAAILLGSEKDIQRIWQYRAAVKFIIFGGLFMIALYHVVIFFLRRQEWSALYFSLFCFSMAVRSLLIEEFCVLIFFPGVSWEILLKLTYFTFSVGFPAFVFFFYSLYPREVKKTGLGLFAGTGIIYTLMILFFPAAVFTRYLFAFQIVLLAGAVYGILVLALAAKQKREDAVFMLVVYLFFFLCILNDTLHHNMVITTAYTVPFGFFGFIFLQSILLSRKYSRAFIQIETLFEEKTKLEGTALTLETLSYLDSLTGISNRRRLDEYLLEEWRRAQRSGSPLSLIMIDIDNFKQYNDHYGHIAGDDVLKRTSRALESAFSRPGDFIARYGGEEFAVILPHTDRKGAVTIAEIMRKKVMELRIPHHFSTAADVVSISLGSATIYPDQGATPEELIKEADKALYRAKQEGKNRTCT